MIGNSSSHGEEAESLISRIGLTVRGIYNLVRLPVLRPISPRWNLNADILRVPIHQPFLSLYDQTGTFTKRIWDPKDVWIISATKACKSFESFIHSFVRLAKGELLSMKPFIRDFEFNVRSGNLNPTSCNLIVVEVTENDWESPLETWDARRYTWKIIRMPCAAWEVRRGCGGGVLKQNWQRRKPCLTKCHTGWSLE